MRRKLIRAPARGVSCEQRLAEALHAAWHRYAAARDAGRRRPSARRVHAFRIASRQLLAIVILVAAAAGTDSTKIRKRLKRGLRATAELRDVDAQLQRVTTLMVSQPLLHPLAAELGHEHQRLADAVRWELAALRLGRRVRQLGQSLFDEYPDGSAEQAFRAAFAATLRRTSERTARRGTSAKTLHRARLAIKQLRYMSEAARALLPRSMAPWIEALHRRQQRLGAIRDLGALVERLRRYRPATPPERRGLGVIVARLIAERRILLGQQARSGPLPLPRDLRAWLADR